MRNLFSQVLNMSMTGSIVILLVMLARLMLKRSPKIFSYALWLVVLFRLLCPVAFTAPVSVLNALEPEIRETSGAASVVYFLPAEANRNPDFTFVPAENQSGPELAQAGKSEHAGLDIMAIVPYVWIAGTGSMILYSIVQYIRLRRKLVGAVAYTGNVYRADYIDTPFVMGILAPKSICPPISQHKNKSISLLMSGIISAAVTISSSCWHIVPCASTGLILWRGPHSFWRAKIWR